MQTYQLGWVVFFCPLAGLQARIPAVCVQANAVLGTLPGNPRVLALHQVDKKAFFFPLKPLPREMNPHQPHIRSEIWKTQFRAFEEAATGHFSSRS